MKIEIMLLIVIVIVVCFVGIALGFETYGNEDVYIQNGVTYIVGHPTPEQRAQAYEDYQENRRKYGEQREIEEQRNHEARIAEINKETNSQIIIVRD